MYWDFEVEIIRAVQSLTSGFFDAFFGFFTLFGSEIFIVVALAACYWSIDKKTGEYIGFAVLSATVLNGILKDAFRFTRPIGVEGIARTSEADRLLVANSPTGYPYSYSFPSGHSQNSAALWGSAALSVRKRWFTALAAAAALLVGISRLYLGVHWPKDVVAGWLLGALTALLISLAFSKFKNRDRFFLVCFGILALAGLLLAGTDDTYKSLGALFGFVAARPFERRFAGFSTDRLPLWKRVLRLALGLALVLAVMAAQKALYPALPALHFLRYAVNIFVGIGLCPLIFVKLGI